MSISVLPIRWVSDLPLIDVLASASPVRVRVLWPLNFLIEKPSLFCRCSSLFVVPICIWFNAGETPV
jgi:hypothetical protein